MSDNIELSIVLDVVKNLSKDIGVGGEVGTVSASLDKGKVLGRSDEVAEQFCLRILVTYKTIFLDGCRVVVTGAD